MMDNQARRPTLMFHLGGPALLSIAQKGLLGGVKVRMEDFMQVSAAVYATGAVLGRARHDRIEILAKMFSDPGQEKDSSEWLQSLANERIQKYGRDPENFPALFFTTEWREMGATWPDDHRTVMQLGNKKVPLEKLEDRFKMYILEGIGFGAAFPQKTERMWKDLYETVDAAAWERAKASGVDVPEKPTPVNLADREREVLSEVAEYASEYFPELVEPLGLQLTQSL